MSTLSYRYAQALYQVFQGEEELNRYGEFLQGNALLWQVLSHPGISPREKEGLIPRLLPQAPPLLQDFFRLLCLQGRIGLLPDIVQEYHRLCLQGQNAMEAVMHCVLPPSPEDLAALEQLLSTVHHKEKVTLLPHLDPALLGGFVLEAEGITYDKSVRGMLRALQDSLKARS